MTKDTMNFGMVVANAIGKAVREHGGRAFLVGGCVRDRILYGPDHISPDIDIEVFGIEKGELGEILKPFGVNYVGKSFGVFKLTAFNIDVSIPRRERKTGESHTSFEIMLDPNMSIEEAAKRRDFTINAIYLELTDGEPIVHDPYGGQVYARRRVIKHTSGKFVEDPLRVLRAMQFAARFDFSVDTDTILLCRHLSINHIPRERIFDEFKKLILYGKNIKRGLQFLQDCEWIRFFPELELMVGVEQSPKWHSEGDVWKHTLLCMNEYAKIRGDIESYYDRLVVGLAVLCHDMGKPYATTVDEDGHIHHYGHEAMGGEPARRFLERLTNSPNLIEDVVSLVVNHHRVAQLYPNGSKRAIRRLANDISRIDRLLYVTLADQNGRIPHRDEGNKMVLWMAEKAKKMEIEKSRPEPLIMGRHLIQLGLKPSKLFGLMLRDCYEAQLDGKFSTECGGMVYAQSLLNTERYRK